MLLAVSLKSRSAHAVGCNAGGRLLLKIDLEGESPDATHKGEIDLLSWSLGEKQQGEVTSISGAAVRQFQDFLFTAKTSKASPKLF